MLYVNVVNDLLADCLVVIIVTMPYTLQDTGRSYRWAAVTCSVLKREFDM